METKTKKKIQNKNRPEELMTHSNTTQWNEMNVKPMIQILKEEQGMILDFV